MRGLTGTLTASIPQEEKEMRILSIAAMVLCFLVCVGEVFAQQPHEAVPHGPLPGIDTIPKEAVLLSDKQMQNLFMVSDAHGQDTLNGYTVPVLKRHGELVRQSACMAYIVDCGDWNNFLTTPFTFLGKYDPMLPTREAVTAWVLQKTKEKGGKILTESIAFTETGVIEIHGASLPFVVVKSAGNDSNDSYFANNGVYYDRPRNVFTQDGRILSGSLGRPFYNVREAVEAQKVIYAASYEVQQGKPKRLPLSTGCIDIEESCVFLPTNQFAGPTSLQSPTLGTAMASVLAVFPEYDVFDLAALVNTCAKSYPSLPGGGVVNMPCVIETICEETDSDSSACDVEQPEPIMTVPSIGMLENPIADPNRLFIAQSGISSITGWVCDADEVSIEVNGARMEAGYGTSREDTRKDCGDAANGFSLLFNWNLLGDGVHTVRAYADDTLFASTQVKVTTLGEEFLTGIRHTFDAGTVDNREVMLQWEQSPQNFIITDGSDIHVQRGYASTTGILAMLENPSRGSSQSGISAITGWVCDADEVSIEINGTRMEAGYGTSREDTRKNCGDADNGFSLLFNWNLLGDGVHTVRAYADNVLFASTQVKVTTLGEEFLRGTNAVQVTHPSGIGHDYIWRIWVEWWEPSQNFVIVAKQ